MAQDLLSMNAWDDFLAVLREAVIAFLVHWGFKIRRSTTGGAQLPALSGDQALSAEHERALLGELLLRGVFRDLVGPLMTL